MLIERRNGGYIGLLVLLISVAIIALLFARSYLTSEKPSPEEAAFQPLSASGTPPVTGYERARADEDAARAIQEKLNEENRATNRVIAE